MRLRANHLMVFCLAISLVLPICAKAFAGTPDKNALNIDAELVLDETDRAVVAGQALVISQDPGPYTMPCSTCCGGWTALPSKFYSNNQVVTKKLVLPHAFPAMSLAKAQIIGAPAEFYRPDGQTRHRYRAMLAKTGRLLI